MNTETAIRVTDLTKMYKLYKKPSDRLKEALNLFSNKELHEEKYALKNFSMELKRGETVAIIGKNGSGKSTLLKMIAGVLTPTLGEVEIKGRITSLIELGAGFNPEYTGIENIYFNGSLFGFEDKVIEKKLQTILEFADIGEYIYQPVKTYSSGMFARLAFALMINLEPDILIVDEALSVGDIFFQQKCNTFMKNEMKDVTKIVVTHDMTSVANLADRCIVISEGEKVFDGSTLEGIEYYVKRMHSESFSVKAKESNLISNEVSNLYDNIIEDNESFVDIDQAALGGALEASIKSFKVEVNNLPYRGFVLAGDNVEISYQVTSQKKMSETIFGYIISDKFGNQIFGENTITSLKRNFSFEEGDNLVKLSFQWPEIKEGYYFLTLGIGEGNHELQHTIQCWAHNIFELSCVSPHKTIHCLFNNNIDQLNITNLRR
ncbi:ABC transporter ATP-binding protein [Paenibacillus pseudetheri]|uniref:Vitamin B12 import ATP-binding protein BtuD n=1 Tax=Paenibacillus pseudetheri TaxID=2897682 RepID=A0ABM9BKH7_9BACL|nr:ABC transporter ATP-binding protein [Paenibacillus pseudetheri]CAH1059493.1 Vitamin B12 import ATP-binding protein BtuD [Paenibacillus pseudetheri]